MHYDIISIDSMDILKRNYLNILIDFLLSQLYIHILTYIYIYKLYS